MTLDWENDPELRQIRQEFCDSMTERRALLAQVIEALRAGRAGPEVLEELQSIAHKLAGTAGSYGFNTVTRICEALDEHLDRPGAAADPARLVGYAQLVDESLVVAQGGKDPEPLARDPRFRTLTSGA